MQDQAAAALPPEEGSPEQEQGVLEQVAALIEQLSPEQKKQLLDQLMSTEKADQATVSPQGGSAGVPENAAGVY